MTKRKASDPMIAEIEQALMPGQFIRYDELHEFVGDLEKVEAKLEALVRDGEAERAVHLYEVFLSGCYEKIEQCDDSGAYLSPLFHGLFCGWVKARHAAGRRAEETVQQILGWKEHDELMRYVPKADKVQWHERAIEAAGRGEIGDFLALCVKTKEWDRLAARVHAADHAELESVSHYHSEPAADGLARRDAMAAAKLYRALCLRILTSKKSEYYGAALDHIERARELYVKEGQETE